MDMLLTTRATELLSTSLVWDNVWPVDLGGDHRFGNDWSQLSRFAAAHVSVVSVTLAGDDHNAAQALALVAGARRTIQSRPEALRLALTVDDVEQAHRDGRLAVTLHFEGTECFERNLDLVETFFALGVRQTILAFNTHNSAGGGCMEPRDPGLTRYGRRLVAEMERVGMLVDLSHSGERTTMEALEIATRPMVFSHSNAAAVHPSLRNISDEQVRACAATGGLVGVSGSSEYLGDIDCRTETLFRHIDHFVSLVGADHVGLGIDAVFDAAKLSDWIRRRPDEWPMAARKDWPGFRYVLPEQLVELVSLMLGAGYSDADIGKILGGNYVRIGRELWR